MKVNLSKQPITAEALEKRLRDAKIKAAGIHAHLTSAVTDFQQTHSGAELVIMHREVDVLEMLLDTALRYAESVADQVKKEIERLEEFGRQMEAHK